MAQLLSPDTFEFFATYLLAGYVVIIVRSRFVLGVRPKPAELALEAIIFSLINQLLAKLIADISLVTGLASWLTTNVGLPDYDSKLFFFLKVLVLPALLGMVLGYNLSAGWKNALLRRLSMPVTHPVRKGYDFAFGNERDTGLVEITYDDGTKSRASSAKTPWPLLMRTEVTYILDSCTLSITGTGRKPSHHVRSGSACAT